MGNTGNGSMPYPSGHQDDKLKKAWAEGRQLFRDHDRKANDNRTKSVQPFTLLNKLLDVVRRNDELAAVGGHYIAFFEAFEAVTKVCKSEQLSKLENIVHNTANWFIRTEYLFSTEIIEQLDFLMCVQYFTQMLYSISKLIRRLCRPWWIIGASKDSASPLFSPQDEKKLFERVSNFVYLFEKLCILGRSCCRHRTLAAAASTGMLELSHTLEVGRFQLDFFAEAIYRSSNNVGPVNDIPHSIAAWLYGESDVTAHTAFEDSFFLLYGSTCTGKTKAVVDMALNLRMQNRLLGVYFINTLVESNADNAELFVRSIAFQCALYCPHLRKEIMNAARRLLLSDQLISPQNRRNDNKFTQTSRAHKFNRGSCCASRAVDMWQELIVGPFNCAQGMSPRGGGGGNNLKGILKNAGDVNGGVDISVDKCNRSMFILIDGFQSSPNNLAISSFTDSISRFLVAIQHCLPPGIRVVLSGNRDADLMACCRLPKTVSNSLFSALKDQYQSVYTGESSRHIQNPITVLHCMNLDPLSTATVLNITHGKCGCPTINGEAVCSVCSHNISEEDETKTESRRSKPSRYQISSIVKANEMPLIDVLLASRCGHSSILYTSLAIDEIISRFRGSINVAYDIICPAIPQNLSDLYRIQMERIVGCDQALFHDIGALMIMLICNAKRFLSVAEVAWLLCVRVETVLRVAKIIEYMFPLVYCPSPANFAELRIEQHRGDIWYVDGALDAKKYEPDIFNPDKINRNAWQNDNNRYNGSIATDPLDLKSTELKSATMAQCAPTTTTNNRRSSYISVETHVEDFQYLKINSSTRRETTELFLDSTRESPSFHEATDACTSEGSSTDLTSEKLGLNSLLQVPEDIDESFYGHGEEDLHQYFYPIHSSLVEWCRNQRHLFPVEIYGRTSSRDHPNNCDDIFVSSSLEITHLNNLKATKKELLLPTSLSIKQRPIKRLLFASYNYKHLLGHINDSMNYKRIAPCILFSLSWLQGVLKATNVDFLLRKIDQACREEWMSLNYNRPNGFIKSSWVQGGPDSSHSGGSSELSLMNGEKHEFGGDIVLSGRPMSGAKYYTCLRYLWLTLSRGYFGLHNALSKYRESSLKNREHSELLLLKELCFHIINWLSPISQTRFDFADNHSADGISIHSGAASGNSSSSLSMDSDHSSFVLPILSGCGGDHSYISGLVGTAQRINYSGIFRHSVPKLLYPRHYDASISDHYLLMHNGGDSVPLFGHTNKVVGMSCVCDAILSNEYIASCSDDCSVRVWDSVTNACIVSFSSHDGSVTCLLALPRGVMASGSLDLTIHILSTPEKKVNHKLIGHEGVINCMAHMPRYELLASGSEDRTIRIWNYKEGGAAVMVFYGHRKAVTSLLVVDPPQRSKGEGRDGTDSMSVLLSGSSDKSIRSWNINTGKSEKTFRGHTDRVVSIRGPFCWSSSDSLVRIRDFAENSEADIDRYISNFRADNFRFCSSQDGDVVVVWNFNDSTVLFQITGSPITDIIDLSNDRLATACFDKVIAVWNVNSCKQERILHGHTKKVSSLARVRAASHQFSDKLSGSDSNNSGDLSEATEDLLCSGSDDCSVIIWNIMTGDCIYKLEGPTHSISCVLMSVTFGKLVASCGCWDGALYKWILPAPHGKSAVSLNQGRDEENKSYVQHSNRVTVVSPVFIPGGTYSEPNQYSSYRGNLFGTASLDGNIRIWMIQNTAFLDRTAEVETTSLSCVSRLQFDRVSDVCFFTQLSDGRLVVSGLEKTIVIYPFPVSDVIAGLEGGFCNSCMLSSVKAVDNFGVVVIKGLQGRVTALSAITGPIDGAATELLLTGSDDYIIRLYSVQTGACVRSLDGHVGSITCLQSLVDGRILSGSDDGNIFLWNLNSKSLGLISNHQKTRIKPYISILKGKCSVSAMYIYKPIESAELSPVATSNMKMNSDIQLCAVTSDGVIHMRKVDAASIAAMDLEKTNSSLSGKKMMRIPSTKDIMTDNENRYPACGATSYYPVIHQLLSRGTLYGLMDAYSLKCAVGHHVSNSITVGFSLCRNMIIAGTITGEIYAFRVFDYEDSTTENCLTSSISPMAARCHC